MFERFQAALVNYIYRLVGDWEAANDLAQDTFLKAYSALPRTDDSLQISPWLYRIATNTALDSLRADWSDDAVWHIIGTHDLAGSVPVDDYFTMLKAVFVEADYRFEVVGLRQLGELVFVDIVSEGSIAGNEVDPAGGVMIYRVVDGKITEGWAIGAGSGGATLF